MPGSNYRRVVVAARPTEGELSRETFRIEQVPLPTLTSDGQVLLRTVFLSLDPYMRGRLIDGPSYAQQAKLGEPMLGATVSRVEQSRHPQWRPGDLVLGYSGWQEYDVSDGTGLSLVDDSFVRPSYALGVLGMPGFTAYIGMTDIGQPKPGETVVVAAATGGVGAVVGQLAKLAGARVVGIAGGPEKCAYAVAELGFDVCLDRRDADFVGALEKACAQGIDVYFENVGGKVFGAVARLLNLHARVPLCGVIARYNRGANYDSPGPDHTDRLIAGILFRRLRMEGFMIADHEPRRPEFLANMKPWVREGRIKTREDIVPGLEQAPDALRGLLKGENFGKLLVQVSEL